MSGPPTRAASDVTITVTQGGIPVEGAFVALIGPAPIAFAAITDAEGKAVFAQVPDAAYVARASAPGTTSGSVPLTTPGASAGAIAVRASGSALSPVNVFGAQTNEIVADRLPGVFYVSTNVIPQIYRTPDSGGSWAAITLSSDDKTSGFDGASGVRSLAASGLTGEIAALTPTRVYYSHDFGTTWASLPLPLDGGITAKIYWSHPAAPGSLSMLFYAPANQAAMYYAPMPTATSTAAPAGFTAMGTSYRASVDDPITLANGSDAGIMVVGGTVSSASPARAAGDLTFYRVSAAPHGNTDAKLTINSSTVPGAVPTVGSEGTALLPSDMFTVRLGGPLSGPTIGGTTAPNTLIVYSDKANDVAANAALTSCAGNTCTATTTTTFKDAADVTTPAGSFTAQNISSGPAVVTCLSPRALGARGFVSPRGDAGSLGQCLLVKNGGSLDVRQVSNISSAPGMAFDSGYNGSSNNVVLAGDGSRGPVKSARAGANSTDGLSRPYFPPYPSLATGGTGAASGGVAINGLSSASVRDVTFNPSTAAQLAAILSTTGGGRVVGSADSGRTWFNIHGQGGDSLGWWNGPGGTQWLVAGTAAGNNPLLAGAALSSTTTLGASTSLTVIPNSEATALGGGVGSIVSAIEGITGTNGAVVAVARPNGPSASDGFGEGALSIVTMTSGSSATITRVTGGTFTGAAPVSLAYCGTSAPATIKDKTFVARAADRSGAATGSLNVIIDTTLPARTIQPISGVTGDFQVVRADCATATVWAGRNTVSPGGANGSGTPGLLKSTDGGGTFSAIAATGRANQVLQKVKSLAIDPRAPGHVVVLSTDNDIVETKDGGFTWTVLNDSTTAACPATVTGPCGHTFGAVPGTIKLPPKIASSFVPLIAGLRATQINNDHAVAGTVAGLSAVTTRTVQRSTLSFGGVVRGSDVIITGGQTVNLSFASTGVNWTASSDQPFVVVSPASGSGSGTFTVTIDNTSGTAVQPGTYHATITIQTTGVLVSTQTIVIAFTVVAASAAPVGVLDTPADQSSGLQGSIPVSGWALDDIEIDRVELWRDVAPGETTPPVSGGPADPRNGKIFIANATFVDGARPDVEALFGSLPRSSRAGWGYLMLTWGLWNQGNGPFTLYAFAFDKEGNASTIGTKAITVNNTAADKPFGSVDTPGIGATVSGTIPNFGWGLTPKVNGVATCKVQSNGVQVSIDSGPLQPVVYGDVRSDIAGAFAGFSNSAAAGGHYLLDTTQYANGAHTIGWLITDDCNRADGVGSRFFNIQNSGSAATGPFAATAGPGVRMRVAEQVPDSRDAVTVAHGFGQLPAIVTPDSTGLRMARVTQGDRIEMRLPRGYDQAYQLVNGLDRPRPAGSSFDAASNTFYWQPAAGFLGSYELVFVRGGEQIRVRVFVDGPRTP